MRTAAQRSASARGVGSPAYAFAEPFGVGMIEGLLKATQRSGRGRVDMRSATAGRFQIQPDA